jgi:hypothetical protein
LDFKPIVRPREENSESDTANEAKYFMIDNSLTATDMA